MKSLADELKDLGAERDNPCFRSNRDTDATWIIADFVEQAQRGGQVPPEQLLDLFEVSGDQRRYLRGCEDRINDQPFRAAQSGQL